MGHAHPIAVVAASLVACQDEVPAPQIASVTPDHGAPGIVVMVSGNYFCQFLEDQTDQAPVCDVIGFVEFDASPATPSTWSDQTIMVEVPQGITGIVSLRVAVRGRRSNAIDFRVDR